MNNIILLMQIQYPAYWNSVEYHRLFISRKKSYPEKTWKNLRAKNKYADINSGIQHHYGSNKF